MKKIIYIMAVVACLMFANPVTARAYDAGTVEMIGTAGAAGVMGLENAYEASVVARMSGRAGASTVRGAKGISFEIIYSDIKNAFSNLKNGCRTKLSASSIDDLADLVTTNKKGEIVQLIQCKDGTSKSQIDLVIKQVGEGKYASSELVGTTEFATLYNEKAAAQGIAQTATDSGVSTKTTTRVANKALGIAPTGHQLLKSTVQNSALAAAVAGCISLAESVYRGDDVCTATGNLIENTSISAISVALATVTSSELPVLLAAMGANAAVANTAAAVVAFIVPAVGGYALYILADECQFEEKVADVMESVVSGITEIYSNIETEVVSWGISEKAAEAWEAGSETAVSAWEFGKTTCGAAADTVATWVNH